jgi:putative endonuclease
VAAATLDRRARGARVEAAARRHLLASGLRDIAANANYRGGELDLVMLDPAGAEATIVFVEVRYRSHGGFGGGGASIDASTLALMRQLKAVFDPDGILNPGKLLPP